MSKRNAKIKMKNIKSNKKKRIKNNKRNKNI